jgi:hypothetical protein
MSVEMTDTLILFPYVYSPRSKMFTAARTLKILHFTFLHLIRHTIIRFSWRISCSANQGFVAPGSNG